MTEQAVQRAKRFSDLLETLPTGDNLGDIDRQTRAVLIPVVERALHFWSRQSEDTFPIVKADPATCPNCGVPVESLRTPYCSAFCRDATALIRQFRSSLLEGSLLEPERQMGMGQALWNLQGGGFPRRQSLVPARDVAKVIEREGGKCAVCGAPATEIEHTGSG